MKKNKFDDVEYINFDKVTKAEHFYISLYIITALYCILSKIQGFSKSIITIVYIPF